jgi:hypothetical protein
MEQNYRTGAYVSPWAWKGNRTHSINSAPLESSQLLRGTLDWNSLENVQGHIQDLKTIRRISASQQRYYQQNNARDTLVPREWENPFYSQGLGPKNYSEGKLFRSDRARIQGQFYEATERKFLLREEELKGIAAAGGQGAYDEAQAAKKLLGKPFAEGASAAALLRQERGPRAGGGGGGGGGGSRQTSRAGQGERRRLASNDRTTGGGSGGTRRKQLRAANLLGQPLGGGSQSAAQVLG